MVARQKCTLEKCLLSYITQHAGGLTFYPFQRLNCEVYHCIKIENVSRILKFKDSDDQYSLKAQGQELECTKCTSAIMI